MLHLADFRARWPEVRPLVVTALTGDDDTPERVLEALELGIAMLIESDRWAVVLKPDIRTDGFDMRVWVASSKGPSDCLATELAELEDICRGAGARGMVATTRRPGLPRVLKDWELVDTLNSDSGTEYFLRKSFDG